MQNPRIAQVHLLRDRHPIVADERRAPLLLDQHALRFRTERDPHRIGEQLRARQDLASRLISKVELSGCR